MLEIPMKQSTPQGQTGTILIESLVAILIFSIGVLALVGFQANAIKANTDSRARAEASYLADQILGDIWAGDKKNLENYAGTYNDGTTTWGKQVQALKFTSATVGVNADQITVTISWTTPGGGTHNFVQTGRVNTSS